MHFVPIFKCNSCEQYIEGSPIFVSDRDRSLLIRILIKISKFFPLHVPKVYLCKDCNRERQLDDLINQ